MIRVGIVKDAAIGKARNAQAGDVRMLKVQVGKTTKWLQYVPGAGADGIPPNGSLAVFVDSLDLLFIVSSSDLLAPDSGMVAGERKYYATDGGGTVLARLYFKHNGKASLANQTYNLATALTNLVQGIQGATAGGNPIVDATGKITTALTQLQGLLE